MRVFNFLSFLSTPPPNFSDTRFLPDCGRRRRVNSTARWRFDFSKNCAGKDTHGPFVASVVASLSLSLSRSIVPDWAAGGGRRGEYGASGVARMCAARGWSRCLPSLGPGVVASYRRTAIRTSSLRAAPATRCKRERARSLSYREPRFPPSPPRRERGVCLSLLLHRRVHARRLYTGHDRRFSFAARTPGATKISGFSTLVRTHSRKVQCVCYDSYLCLYPWFNSPPFLVSSTLRCEYLLHHRGDTLRTSTRCAI